MAVLYELLAGARVPAPPGQRAETSLQAGEQHPPRGDQTDAQDALAASGRERR
jgi:hypothetical protein